ncbi:leucine carboxyl methyltransferase 1-like [Styela clava]|uniref:leucine carboxyl methyltransferase 1-like n=1 Tax=Styela clava TaxID=7725 RepID=UPI001939E18B|nr:leucine carboxyl methyltransferase 1-like [Styela clava]
MSSDSDLATQATCNDASTCKRYAVQKGYWNDPYISHMVKSVGSRKPPEINRGYYARVESVWILIKKFIHATERKCQIVSLGAGLDTTFWRLCGEELSPIRYIELDFPNVTMRKVQTIKSKTLLTQAFNTSENDTKIETSSIISNKYSLLPADLRDIELVEKQLKLAQIDFTIPTLFLTECVLVYMSSKNSNAILKWVTTNFENCMFVNYEQVNMNDRFGHVMIENLKSRDCDIPGVDVCESLESQRKRFQENGWDQVNCITMWSVYSILPQSDVQRMERLEFMDEQELLEQLLTHYCLCWATKAGESFNLKEIEL